MGVVFRAHAKDRPSVAVKLLGSGDDASRFERELELLKTLSREPGFVPVLDAGTSPRGPWFAMPLMATTLTARLRGGPLGVADALALGRSLAETMGRAHARGLV